jgi:hypothetical protein
MIVVVMIVMVVEPICMIMVVRMIMPLTQGCRPAFSRGIGARLRLKGRLLRAHLATKTRDHLHQDMVVWQAQGTIGQNLYRLVTITDMPGKTRQGGRIGCRYIDHRLWRSMDFDPATLLQLQSIALGQMQCRWQIKQELRPRIITHQHPPAMAIAPIEGDGSNLPGAGP